MLSQNELKISKGLIEELIGDSNFNFKSLAGPNLDDLENYFNKYTHNIAKYQEAYNSTGEAPFTEQKVLWGVSPASYDEEAFQT